MTQLHLVGQHHFLNSKCITLPAISFFYKGHNLKHEAITVNIQASQLEVKTGNYYADVLLETDLGNILIEILVTHKNEIEKTAYYQQQKLASIEYDLSTYINRDIEDAIDALKANEVESTWLYEWCQEQLIQKHEQYLEQDQLRIQKRRLRSAKDSARKFIQGNYILIPSLVETFKHTIGGTKYTEEVMVFTRKEQKLDDIKQVTLTEEYLLLKGEIKAQHIWVVLLLGDHTPDSISQLDGSIIIRTSASSEKNRAIWKWLKYPKLKNKISHEYDNFVKRCELQVQHAKTTEIAVRRAELNSNLYLTHLDSLFKRDYSIWSKWMMVNGLFKPNSHRTHPKLPPALTYIRKYPCLWVFNTWHILTLSYLGEILDSKPKDTKIFYHHIFNELSSKTGLHSDFQAIEQQISPLTVSNDDKKLVLRNSIIEAALQPFANTMAVHCLNGGCIRKGSLLSTISLN